jgi:hypothetical protein
MMISIKCEMKPELHRPTLVVTRLEEEWWREIGGKKGCLVVGCQVKRHVRGEGRGRGGRVAERTVR